MSLDQSDRGWWMGCIHSRIVAHRAETLPPLGNLFVSRISVEVLR
nr:hypothetical protein [Nitrosomonas nitrosa]